MTQAEFTSFLRTVFRHCVQHSINGSIHYHCMDWRHAREMLDAADGIYTEYKQLAIWKKSNSGIGSFYRSQHELVFIFKSGRAKHINNFGLGEKGRHRSNVWEVAGANSFRKGRDNDLTAHSTVKPVELVADCMLDCSLRDDLILDPFSGSGTTLLAAHRTRRRGAAIEIDPIYVDVALARLQTASGLVPALADGRTFAEVAATRARNRRMSEDRDEDAPASYDVGYGKPPRHSQFRKGESGNPRRRPTGARGIKTELKAVLDERVALMQAGKSVKMPMRRVILKALAAQAAKGNVGAADKILRLVIEAVGFEEQRPQQKALSDTDALILRQFLGEEAEAIDLAKRLPAPKDPT